jgi:hypothetical protein
MVTLYRLGITHFGQIVGSNKYRYLDDTHNILLAIFRLGSLDSASFIKNIDCFSGEGGSRLPLFGSDPIPSPDVFVHWQGTMYFSDPKVSIYHFHLLNYLHFVKLFKHKNCKEINLF